MKYSDSNINVRVTQHVILMDGREQLLARHADSALAA